MLEALCFGPLNCKLIVEREGLVLLEVHLVVEVLIVTLVARSKSLALWMNMPLCDILVGDVTLR